MGQGVIMREKIIALIEKLSKKSDDYQKAQAKYSPQKSLSGVSAALVEAYANPTRENIQICQDRLFEYVDQKHSCGSTPFDAGTNFGYNQALGDFLYDLEALLCDNRVEPMNVIIVSAERPE